MANIHVTKNRVSEPDFEFTERKGKGHPDTLADGLAEHLSVQYSKYTLKKFGAVLHHNFDKVGLLGGASHVKFGQGKLTNPIRVLINGRASTKFGDKNIPVKNLLIKWSKEFLLKELPLIISCNNLKFHYNISNQSSPGKTEEKGSDKSTRKYWFEPRGLEDLQELKKLVANDTSLGVGYYPYSKLESLILSIEDFLNSEKFSHKHKWIGSDIKVMGFRYEKNYYITLCIPQISLYVGNSEEYKSNLKICHKEIEKIITRAGIKKYSISINTRDNFEKGELYLTAIGSSIESGDEGLVGRGNRINRIISPTRLMSMEGACGKNPVYHIGKVYYVAAHLLSKKIFKKFKIANEVGLISQSGRDLLDPWIVIINVPKKFKEIKILKIFVEKELKKIPQVTKIILDQKIKIY
jgi:S-adenosylmethionine synthetase